MSLLELGLCLVLTSEDKLPPTELISVDYRFAKAVQIQDEREAETNATNQDLVPDAYATFSNKILWINRSPSDRTKI